MSKSITEKTWYSWQGDSLDENVSACISSLFSTDWDDDPPPFLYHSPLYISSSQNMGLSNLFTDKKFGAGSGQMKAALGWLLMLSGFVFLAKSV